MNTSTQIDTEVQGLILDEIRKMPGYMQHSRNPFVHLIAVKNLILTSHLALFFSSGPPIKITPELAYKHLDLMVAKYDQEMSQMEFIQRLLTQMLPDDMFFLARMRES